jgi:hypothetical protein
MALWEVPLAVLSWLFSVLARLVSRGLIVGDAIMHRGQPLRWQLLSAEAIRKPLRLPVVMTIAPRWNPHAVIATIGPLRARHSIGVDARAVADPVGTWTIVAYRFPLNRIVGSLSSRDVRSDDRALILGVEPGTYTLALRYYHSSSKTELPAVVADNIVVAPTERVPDDLNDRLYQDLPARMSWFYQALHYYVYTMLRLRRYLPRAFIDRELLPVGNPETYFSYGHLPAGRLLHVRVTELLLTSHDVYLTIYGRDSFPLHWQQIVAAEHTSDSFDRDAFYVVRVHRNASTKPPHPCDVCITVRQSRPGRQR